VIVKFCDQFHPHIKDHKILPSLVLLMSSFSVFDSKGGEFVDQKQAHPIINTKIHKFKNFKVASGIKHTSGIGERS
jgi:hypothetical protein